jgi:hypothetical protein
MNNSSPGESPYPIIRTSSVLETNDSTAAIAEPEDEVALTRWIL